MASWSYLTGQLEKKYLLRCDGVSDERDTGDGLQVIVESSEEGVYIVIAVVAAMVVAVVVAAAAFTVATVAI